MSCSQRVGEHVNAGQEEFAEGTDALQRNRAIVEQPNEDASVSLGGRHQTNVSLGGRMMGDAGSQVWAK